MQDFTSLYPWVNKNCEYWIGHPEVFRENFGKVADYKGLIYCRVLPPKDQFWPVLPFKAQGKLVFALCGSCAKELRQGVCDHSDEERVLEGVWTTDELTMAEETGYVILEIFEVWHFKKTSKDLFRGYVNTFLKLKTQASGFPPNVKSEKEKDDFIRDFFEKEGILLEKDKIEFNAVIRSISKFLLNSLWGKFAQRERSKVEFVNDFKPFIDILVDPTKDVKWIDILSEEMAQLTYDTPEGILSKETRESTSSLFIAIQTTSFARLKLFELIRPLGPRVCYMDTDSAVFLFDENGYNPPLGNYLGDLTDELSGHGSIVEFLALGPKCYSYVCEDGYTNCKLKGFRQTFEISTILGFTDLKDLVLGKNDEVQLRQSTLKRDRATRLIRNQTEMKKLRVTADKRHFLDNHLSVPFGFTNIDNFFIPFIEKYNI